MLVIWLLCGLIVVCAAAILGLFLLVNRPIPKGEKVALVPPKVVLAVFAHPDDEIMVCGSLARWKKAGAAIHLLYLTHGEDGPTGGIVPKAMLGTQRATELQEVARILKADSLSILSYPDRYLNTIEPALVIEEIANRIRHYQPDTLVCFDNTIGLYGHTDHAFAGTCAQAAAQQCGVPQTAVMTLGAGMIAIALNVSTTFRERYHGSKGLPAANCAVSIARYGAVKKQVCLTHKTQWEVVEDVQPGLRKLPAAIYYRIFSREYYQVIPQAKWNDYSAMNGTDDTFTPNEKT